MSAKSVLHPEVNVIGKIGAEYLYDFFEADYLFTKNVFPYFRSTITKFIHNNLHQRSHRSICRSSGSLKRMLSFGSAGAVPSVFSRVPRAVCRAFFADENRPWRLAVQRARKSSSVSIAFSTWRDSSGTTAWVLSR